MDRTGLVEAADSPERKAADRRRAVFDAANARNAVTDLQERGEEFVADLEKLSGPQVEEIPRQAAEFLTSQGRELTAGLSNYRQKAIFRQCFAAFSVGFTARCRALADAKVFAYQKEVTERQNRSFTAMALRPENLFNDELQTSLRDMCLLNLENLLEDVPDREKKDALDAASRDFCLAVLERRLEADPTRMRTMLDAPAVFRVIGESAVGHYRRLAEQGERRKRLDDMAREWAAAGLSVEQAEETARRSCRDVEDRKEAFARYREFRELRCREEANRLIARTDQAWREVVMAGQPASPRLEELRRSDPEFAEKLSRALAEARENGGSPPSADRTFLLRKTEAFDPAAAAAELCEPDRVVELFAKLGGAGAEELKLYLRLFNGKAGPDDIRRIEDLRLAANRFEALLPAGGGNEEMNVFLGRFDEAIRIEETRRKRLTVAEKAELADRTASCLLCRSSDGALSER